MTLDLESTQTSRTRLLAAGKELFARVGYEQASTAAIARAAGTSESQLSRNFEGKAGLLEAIFNQAWAPLNEAVQKTVADAPRAHEAVLDVLAAVVKSLGADGELAYLFLFEGRRLRGTEISVSKGFLRFAELVRSLVHRGQQDGSFRSDLADTAIAASLMGAAEGMMRERLLAERAGRTRPFSDREIRRVFESLVAGIAL